MIHISHIEFVNNTVSQNLIHLAGTKMISVTNSHFSGNANTAGCYYYCPSLIYLHGFKIDLYFIEFVSNKANGTELISIQAMNTSIHHSKFIENSVTSVLYIDGIMITIKLNEFIQNEASYVVDIRYYAEFEINNNNIFINNIAAYDVYILTTCRPGLSLSLGSSRCIPCSDHWLRDVIGIVAAAFVAGIGLVISMLALNLTVAVGTLNGILFYANTIAVNTDTYFKPFTSPNLVTVFISWLNLDIGFDVCFINNDLTNSNVILISKALLQLVFLSYVIVLVVVVIVASECSSKFAKMIGKGNPVAVLATMVLLSYSKFFNAIMASVSLLYRAPAYGSRNVDVSRLGNALANIEGATGLKAISYFLLVISILIIAFGMIFTNLVFFWQWLLQYQHKAIFKWVRYQKLQLFLEPYHAPYTAKFRFWTGLLLFVRILLYLISVVNFSLDPRIELMAVICVICGLIFLKGVTAKRIYKNWPLDVMETFIYFNLVAFSALTWYNLDFKENQVAVAYTSVMIMFILLLGVIIFHVLRYTRLYKCSFFEKAFKWMTSRLLEKKPKEHPPNDSPEELDGYRLERLAAGDQNVPVVTYSVVGLSQSQDDIHHNSNEQENY